MGWGSARTLPLLAALSVLIGPGACHKSKDPPRVIINAHTWYVEPVWTAQDRSKGLSGRTHLNENSGMLFIFPDSRKRTFWMHGCLIRLDLALIGPDLRIVAIHTMHVEADFIGRTEYTSDTEAQFALEVPAGALERARVRVGDTVQFAGAIPNPSKASPTP